MSNFKHPKVELVPPNLLRPNPRNARKHSKKQVELLTASILKSKILLPIVVDDENMILAGHARLIVANNCKFDRVPVIRVKHLTEAQKRAFMLADNRIQEISTWDDDILGEELLYQFEAGTLEITGFTTADLDFSIPEAEAKHEREDIELPTENEPTVSRLGDLWIVGPHRLICGDARDASIWELLLANELAVLIFGDLPYNLKIDGFVRGTGAHREFAMASGEMSPPEFTAFLRSIFRNCARFSAPGAIIYQCMDRRHIREMLDASDGVFDEFKQMLIWDKQVGGQGGFYRSQYELIFVFKSGKAKHINNFGLGENGRYRTNILSYPGANMFRKGRKADLDAHATVKPIALVVDLLLDCSNRGDLVLDPTAGSGTILLAAHKTGRRSAAIEIEPRFVDTALKRLTAVTGIDPILAGDSRSFAEITIERLGEGA